MFNCGRFFDYPTQSKYATLHQFRLSNALLSVKNLRADNWRLAKGKFDSIPSIVEYCEKERNIFSRFDATMRTERTLDHFRAGYNPIKHCPECSKLGYHHLIYDLPWLRTCPLHHIELLKHCPECSQQWPTSLQLLSRKCATCGYAKIRDRLERVAELIEDDNRWEPLLNLEKALIEVRVTKHRVQLIGNQFLQPMVLNPLTIEGTDCYSHIASGRHSIGTGLKNVKGTFTCKTVDHNNSQLFDYQHNNHKDRFLVEQSNRKLSAQICQFIANATSCDHRIEPSYRATSSLNIYDQSGYCPYCAAFSFWLRIVNRETTLRLGTESDVKAKFTKGAIYQQNGLIEISKKMYFVENHFMEWLYERNSQCLFFMLLNRLLLARLADYKLCYCNSVEELLTSTYLDKVFQPFSYFFSADLAKKVLYATMCPSPSIAMIPKQLLIDTTMECDNSKDYWKKFGNKIETRKNVPEVHPSLYLTSEERTHLGLT